jgi:hypothetical protein
MKTPLIERQVHDLKKRVGLLESTVSLLQCEVYRPALEAAGVQTIKELMDARRRSQKPMVKPS